MKAQLLVALIAIAIIAVAAVAIVWIKHRNREARKARRVLAEVHKIAVNALGIDPTAALIDATIRAHYNESKEIR
ncbi:hypothetical protein AB0J43_00380 [Nonomuraea fuscirosea]